MALAPVASAAPEGAAEEVTSESVEAVPPVMEGVPPEGAAEAPSPQDTEPAESAPAEVSPADEASEVPTSEVLPDVTVREGTDDVAEGDDQPSSARAAAVAPAAAPVNSEWVTVELSQETGLPTHLDAASGPGFDVSVDDEIIRTNDVISYTIEVALRAGTPEGTTIENPVLTIALPQGQQFVDLVDGRPTFRDTKGNYNVQVPAFCKPGSTLTYSSGTTMPNPVLTGDFYATLTNLPTQTLACIVDPVSVGNTRSITVHASVRPEVPHGTEWNDVRASASGDNLELVTSNPVAQTVSAATKWDLSINGSQVMPTRENTDFVKQNGVESCVQTFGAGTGDWSGDPTGLAQQQCFVGGYSVTLSQPSGGYGGVPMQDGSFTYTFDVSPETIWSGPAFENGEPTGLTIFETVKAHNDANPDDQIILPGGVPTSAAGGHGWVYQSAGTHLSNTNATVSNSVRNSGTTTLTKYDGNKATFTVTGADTTAYTVPTYSAEPANFVLWPERGYVYAQRVFIHIPVGVLSEKFEFFDAIDRGGVDGAIQTHAFIDLPQSSLTFETVAGAEYPTNQYSDVDGEFNNYRNMGFGLVNRILVANQWMSPVPVGDVPETPLVVEGPSTATSPQRYWPGNPGAYGPTGEAAIYKGDGVAVPGEFVINGIMHEGRSWDGGGTLTCTAFDNSKVVIDPVGTRGVPTNPSPRQQVMESGPLKYPTFSDVRTDGGGATWIYGSMYQYRSATKEAASSPRDAVNQYGMGDRYSDFSVRYGVGAVDDTGCVQPIAWYSAEQVNSGVDGVTWETINKVEVYLETFGGGNVQEFRTLVAVGMRTLDNDPGTIIPTHTNYSQEWFSPRHNAASQTVEGVRAGVYLASGVQWDQTTGYDAEVNNSGGDLPFRLGDRLTAVDILGRVVSSVETDTDSDAFVRTDLWTPNFSQNTATQPRSLGDIASEYENLGNVPLYGPGDAFRLRLQPLLDGHPMPPAGSTVNVLLETCIPASLARTGAPAFTAVNGGTATGSSTWIGADPSYPYGDPQLRCAPGEEYLALYWPGRDVADPLPMIHLPVAVKETAMNGIITTQSVMSVWSGSTATGTNLDPSLFTQRADRSRAEIQAPNGFRVAKFTPNTQVFVDEIGNVSTPTITWNIEARNINSGNTISRVDVIDYLPESGVNGSSYAGGRKFISTRVTSGEGVDLYVTRATLGSLTIGQWSDPINPANQPGGSTVWCTLDGSDTYPAGGDTAACPATPDEVTGVRALHPGALPNGDLFSFEILQSAEGRANGDVMVNEVTMRASGIDLPVFSRSNAVWDGRDVPPNPGAISGNVWDDFDRDGIWDEGEPPLRGVEVTLRGTPNWCDAKMEAFLAGDDPDTIQCAPIERTVLTDENGFYRFTEVHLGVPTETIIDDNGEEQPNLYGPRTPYTITFTTPDGYDPTVPGRSLAPTTQVELNADNQFVTGIDAGYIKPATLAVEKAVVDAATGVAPVATTAGDVLTYTVTATNTSERPFVTAEPAVLIDDLSGVLSGATLEGDPTATAGSAAIVGNLLVWEGTLESEASATITYQVRVTATTATSLVNTAFVTTDPVDEDTGLPTDPETGTVPSTPDECEATTCATTTTPIGALAITKEASPAGEVAVGTPITYTVRITNESEASYTDARPATFVDDLTDVLDVAAVDPGSVTATAGHAEFVGSALVWYGPLDPGASATVTYSVTATSAGTATNVAFVTPPGQIDPDGPGGTPPSLPEDPGTGDPVTPPAECVAPTCATTTTPVTDPALPAFSVEKTASADSVEVGEELTYTVTVANTTDIAAGVVVVVDDMGDVLDNAVLVGAPSASAGSVDVVGDQVVWSGSLGGSESVTITYTVRATSAGSAVNTAFVAPPGTTPDPETGEPVDPETGEPVTPPAECVAPGCATTTTPVVPVPVPGEPTLVVEKSVSAASVEVGEELTYTVTVTNTSAVQADEVMVVDDLADVVAYAELIGGITASAGTAERVENLIVWTGSLAGSESVTITYTFRATAPGSAVNVAFVAPPGTTPDPDTGVPVDPGTGTPVTPPAECVGPECSPTITPVVPVPTAPPTTPGTPPVTPAPTPTMPPTGADAGVASLVALGLAAAGILAFGASRRRLTTSR
ncbi:MAG: SdrD B-like domain-containing protein [bacterium]|nr:SdrD B-like domain-containing protein [bacterium]